MVPSRKTPTIQDVARHANVSAATVSRALSNPERVSEATRARVAEAVRDTGYTINQTARSLRLRAARTILIALPNIGNPFYSTILDAVVHEAASRSYGVLVATPFNGDTAHWVSEYFSSNRVDGLLLFDGSVDTSQLRGPPGDGVRVPLVVAYDELPDPLTNAVLTDNRQAARRAVGHLLSLGHRRIGHVTGHSRNGEPNERLVGYREAMTAAGLPPREDWTFVGDYSMPSGAAAAHRFLALGERPTAMFCGNDEEAIGFIAVLRANGLDCPRDVSVIGFDDIAVAANYAPALTTMRQPREEIGRRATETLIDILDGDRVDRGPVRIVLTSELVVRESTAAIWSAAGSPLHRAPVPVPVRRS
jgi:LacI family repressor for deo operon, udp, cdd, tsx, nupC, and nupG